MAARSKKRGVDNSMGQEISLDEKRRQGNINLANRTLDTLFGHVYVDGETIVQNNGRSKRVTYTSESLYEKAREYFENIVEANENNVSIIPDIEDFCMFANISRETFMKMRRSEDSDMQYVASNIANAIANCKKQSALQGTLNPTIFAIDMNNNHGYVQAKAEFTVNSNVSMQQIEANIADIANRLPLDDEMEGT